jgi:phage-related protein
VRKKPIYYENRKGEKPVKTFINNLSEDTKGKIRVIYAYMFKDYIVLLHGIIKKTAKVPERDKTKAIKRMKDFQAQYNDGLIKLR